MAEYIDNVMSVSEREEEKIKTPFLHIVVGGAPEKPCYSILWVDSETQAFQFGYSSYCLDYVREWRDRYFEITTEDFPAADVVEVKHGEWNVIECNKENGTIFVECECGAVFKLSLFDFGLCYNYCPNCGAKMEGR